MSKIIVGVDRSEGSKDAIALALASSLVAITGAQLMLVNAYPYDTRPSRALDAGFEAYLRQDSQELLERLRTDLDAAVEELEGDPRAEAFFAVGGAGPILVEESEQLDLLVLGSRGYGPMHSVLVGGVSGRVVREAACPVIVLPREAGHGAEDSLFAEAAALHG